MGPSARRHLRPARPALALVVILAVSGAGDALAQQAVATQAQPAGLPELVRTKHRSFTIPFRLPKPQDPDADAAAQRVILEVSKDLGATWHPAGETAPATGSFTYTADVDGEYWFRLRALDRKGRMRGGAGPDTRVLVDAAGPRLAARVWKGPDGEIMCRYAAVDDSIDMAAVKLEYRLKGEQAWKTVASEGVLARQSPAHLVGEEIWWAGEKVDALSVQITVADSSANRTVRQFTLEATDPRVDQAALAQELGVPPLPTQGESESGFAAESQPPAAPTSSAVFPPPTASGSGWSAEKAAWAGGEPRPSGGDRVTSVLVKRTVGSTGGGLPPPAATAARAAQESGRPLEYQGKPLLLSRSRRFAWDYETPATAPGATRMRAVLWSTRDGGVTWQQTAVDADGRSPIDVALPTAGLYGFRLEFTSDTAATTTAPRSGDAPESWVGIDEEPPQVELVDVARLGEADQPAFVVRYACRDPLPAPRAARLLYSPHAEGPWATIAAGLENQGEHRWQPDRSVPARVFIRVEAADAAGNVGAATTAEPVDVAQSRVVGKLGGLRPLPSATPDPAGR